MAKRKSDPAETVEVQEVTTTSTPSVPFWEKNPKLVLYVVGGLAALVAGWLLYKNMIVGPKHQEALSAMWQAEQQFGRDSFQMALDNPGGGFDGFATLADKYSGTKAGNGFRQRGRRGRKQHGPSQRDGKQDAPDHAAIIASIPCADKMDSWKTKACGSIP